MIPTEIQAAATLLASARSELLKYEEAADTLVRLLTGIPRADVRIARSVVLVAKQALHLARLAVMEGSEAVERVRGTVEGMVEPRAVGGQGRTR